MWLEATQDKKCGIESACRAAVREELPAADNAIRVTLTDRGTVAVAR